METDLLLPAETIQKRRKVNMGEQIILSIYITLCVIVGTYLGFVNNPEELKDFEDGKILDWFQLITFYLGIDLSIRLWLIIFWITHPNYCSKPNNIGNIQLIIIVLQLIKYIGTNSLYFKESENEWRKLSPLHSKGMFFIMIYGGFLQLNLILCILICGLVVLLFIILFVYICCVGHLPNIPFADRLATAPLPQSLKDKLLEKKYDPNIFKHEKLCSICLLDYKEDDKITPLPCDSRHYFHAECISQWLDQHGNCPICKKPITKDDLQGSYSHDIYQNNLKRNTSLELQNIHHQFQNDDDVPPDAFQFKINQ